MSEHTPFLEIFPGCADLASPAELQTLSERLKADYGLSGVGMAPDFPRPKLASTSATTGKAPASGDAPKGDVLYGRAIKQHPVPMNTLSLESGKVTVEGDVVAVTSRVLQKRGGAVLGFDITHRTSSSPKRSSARTTRRKSAWSCICTPASLHLTR